MDVLGNPQPRNLWIAHGKTTPLAAFAFVRKIAARIGQFWFPAKRGVDQPGSHDDGHLARKGEAPERAAPTRTVTRAVRPTR